jgi:hypothetical protein
LGVLRFEALFIAFVPGVGGVDAGTRHDTHDLAFGVHVGHLVPVLFVISYFSIAYPTMVVDPIASTPATSDAMLSHDRWLLYLPLDMAQPLLLNTRV